jgi:hypothetical protein
MISNLIEQVEQLPGYRIGDSHFRIGSKLHIRDFFYAKRFFQNHFFASRFAFLLARKILDTLSEGERKVIMDKGVSLIGYGIYSELLMSLLEKFLREAGPRAIKKINHNLVKDSEDLELIKQEPLLGCGIIIVPIASTFSTSMKIEASFKQIVEQQQKKVRIRKSDIPFLVTHYNLLYVADQTADFSSDPTPMEESFGWVHKDETNKRIRVTAFFEEKTVIEKDRIKKLLIREDVPLGERAQQYFIRLGSQWQNVYDCKYCFPKDDVTEAEDLLKERPLFETDRTSVTPISIFDFPKARIVEEDDRDRKFILEPDMLRYGYHFRNHSHFFYRIDTEVFLRKNVESGAVLTWLKKCRAHADLQHTDADRVLIIAACHYSNAAFINLVNEQLFGSAANIVHFDPQKDYVQNFRLVYGSVIQAADKIVFVDDTLKTGSTLSRIEEFVHYARRQPILPGPKFRPGNAKGIGACIFLINKSQHLLGLDKDGHPIFAFAHLHLFTSLAFDEDAPLALERKRYDMLQRESFLDSLQYHFYKQKNKLDPEREPFNDKSKKRRHLLMLAATHRIYQFFSQPELCSQDPEETFESFAAKLCELPIPFSCSKTDESADVFKKEMHDCLLKVLTQSPFTQYEPLRKLVFQWVLSRLEEQVKLMHTAIKEENALSYADFKDLEFLVRRAGLMNSNYLISVRMLDFLRDLCGKKGLPRLHSAIEAKYKHQITESLEFKNPGKTADLQNERQETLQSIAFFTVFYVAQVKELLLLNEARSIQLEKALRIVEGAGEGNAEVDNKEDDETVEEESGKINAGFKQLSRILRTENAVVIQKFYDYLHGLPEWKSLYHKKDDSIGDQNVNPELKPISDLLSETKVSNHPHYKHLAKFFEELQQKDPVKNDALLNYLWVQYFIDFDKQKDLPLKEKTKFVFNKLKEMLSFSGSFMIIQDSQRRFYLVHDKDSDDKPLLRARKWENDSNKLLVDFLKGIPDASETYVKTIMELEKSGPDKPWEDIYSVHPEARVRKDLSQDLLPDDMTRLVLMRLSHRDSKGNDVIEGIVGFGFHGHVSSAIGPNDLIYLILLRNTIGRFVINHHKNSEFTDWRIAESYRHMEMLAGHGKQTLQLLASRHPMVFLEIVQHMAQLQTLIMLDETSFAVGGEKNIKKRFAKFYHVQGNQVLKASFFNEDLKNMVELIYKDRIVECKVPCKIEVLAVDPALQFAFHSGVLNIILFELILNAKKNRWHFLAGEHACEGRTENELTIAVSVIGVHPKREMQIKITNTGPRIDTDVMNSLRDKGKNVKPDDVNSGTALIKTLIYDILEKCSIDYAPVQLNTEESMHLCEITLTLTEMTQSDGR